MCYLNYHEMIYKLLERLNSPLLSPKTDRIFSIFWDDFNKARELTTVVCHAMHRTCKSKLDKSRQSYQRFMLQWSLELLDRTIRCSQKKIRVTHVIDASERGSYLRANLKDIVFRYCKEASRVGPDGISGAWIISTLVCILLSTSRLVTAPCASEMRTMR